jgi:choline dehydrogenase-like flavoprotein
MNAQSLVAVIGSGPSGVAVSKALLSKGVSVCMIDVGESLPPDIEAHRSTLGRQSPDEWSASAVNALRAKTPISKNEPPLKRHFGSDYVYQLANEDSPLNLTDVSTSASYAKGGLSTVWGASILPYRQADMSEWPFQEDRLAPHYRSVLSWMPISGEKDDLDRHFPLYTDNPRELALSSQSKRFLADLNKHKEGLSEVGVVAGKARLAMGQTGASEETSCQYCGLCLYGCPYHVIYNSDHTLDDLKKNDLFSYRNGLIVERFDETEAQVTLTMKGLDGRVETSTYRRVYLACGVISTAKIMLKSSHSNRMTLTAKDSQYFLIPILRYANSPNVTVERLHTLSQLFIEILNDTVSQHTVHLQLYSYNDIFFRSLKQRLGPFIHWKWGVNQLLGRLLMIQGYLHSNDSHQLEINLAKDGNALNINKKNNIKTSQTVANVQAFLHEKKSLFRAFPLKGMSILSPPGRGFHTGSTFPMKQAPGPGESDMMGRPHGFNHVHIVDASVLPTIPATTITLTVMANAYRIGLESG